MFGVVTQEELLLLLPYVQWLDWEMKEYERGVPFRLSDGN